MELKVIGLAENLTKEEEPHRPHLSGPCTVRQLPFSQSNWGNWRFSRVLQAQFDEVEALH